MTEQAVAKTEQRQGIVSFTEGDLVNILKKSLYPGASDESVKMVLSYCQAANLDPMQKPVHIVPMWDKDAGAARDVVMPGIGLYRTQASRTGEYAGVGEPEFGPDITEKIGGVEITYPAWCRIVVRRKLSDGTIAEFAAVERWKENYAVKGGKERSIAPNSMWRRRPYGQIAKCTEAQALRKAFPELGSGPTADEMEGKAIVERDMGTADVVEEIITIEQLSNLTDQIVELTPDEESTKRYTAKICETMKCESLDKLPAEKYDAVLAILNGRRKRIEESKTKEQAQ